MKKKIYVHQYEDRYLNVINKPEDVIFDDDNKDVFTVGVYELVDTLKVRRQSPIVEKAPSRVKTKRKVK